MSGTAATSAADAAATGGATSAASPSPPAPNGAAADDAAGDDVAALKAQVEALRKKLAETELKIGQGSANAGAGALAARPSATAMSAANAPDPFRVTLHTVVLLGAEGNLALKKTFPALFTLYRRKHLAEDVVLIGYARESLNDDSFRKMVYRSIYEITHPGTHAYPPL